MMDHEAVKSFIENQLMLWPLAKANFDALALVKRRKICLGDYTIGVQLNPGRIVSTGANISANCISRRPCFLCESNRPKEQITYAITPGWELLVNPYPIFPVHLTIASSSHIPQSHVPDDIVAIAERLPGMVVFFNGAKAGASAPDHLHLQAVLKEELPLINMVERLHPENEGDLKSANQMEVKFPFLFFSGVVNPDYTGMSTLEAGLRLGGLSPDGKLTEPTLVNIFFWIGVGGKLRFISIPRRKHRPVCYTSIGEANRMVSPGCIDMAGLIITPLEKDFNMLSAEEVSNIYSEVAFTKL